MLQAADAGIWARNRALAAATVGIAAIATALGIDIVFIKGIGTEARWYGRMGERPTWDMDVVLAPWHRHRAVELVTALQPTHSMIPDLLSILQRDRIQSIDLGYQGLPVDLHLDPIKMEVAAIRFPERLWERVERFDIQGREVPVFDPTVSLLLAAHALNKDRFRYLIGYADVMRIAQDSRVDISMSARMAQAEGLLTPFWATLNAVSDDLGVPIAERYSPFRVWSRLWGPSIRLSGKESSVRFRYRQALIPLFDRDRWLEVIAAWWRRLFPSQALLRRLYPNLRGPYLTRIVSGRIRRRIQRHRQRRAVRTIVG
jgi:hypothetical protein